MAKWSRVLNMADGVMLLVDAFEGPCPWQVPVYWARPRKPGQAHRGHQQSGQAELHTGRVHEQVFDLMFHLEANEDQLTSPVVYGGSKQG
ncbi:MAG: hypothetical protein IPH63_17600 [Flavobacteriales bacterium]|nr:hypothetical protein [Flavobacteriales bacterium]